MNIKPPTLKKINIAIDGYSSCGKSTIAKALAKALNYIFIDTGAMYRAVTLYFLENNIPLDDPDAIDHALRQIHIHFERDDKGRQHTFLNGRNVENQIRSMEVARHVSAVAALPAVRKVMVQQQRKMAKNKGVVMDGRDIGTVVLPDAELKIFVTAQPQIRAQRRYLELQEKGLNTTPEEVAQNLAQRDYIDSHRKDSPLRQAHDAILLDTSYLSREEQVQKALSWAQKAINQKEKENHKA